MTDRSVITALLRKSHQRLDAARTLCTEGHYEDSINRAYYAMYLAALALLHRKSVEITTHAGLITSRAARAPALSSEAHFRAR